MCKKWVPPTLKRPAAGRAGPAGEQAGSARGRQAMRAGCPGGGGVPSREGQLAWARRSA